MPRNECFLPRNNGNHSESIPRNFFGTKFRSQPYLLPVINYKRPIIIMDVTCSKLSLVQNSPFKGCNSLLSNGCLLFSGNSLSGSSLSGISISSVAYSCSLHVNTFSSICRIRTVLKCRSCPEIKGRKILDEANPKIIHTSGAFCDRKLSSIMIKSNSPPYCN
jgi:hypothetical protein